MNYLQNRRVLFLGSWILFFLPSCGELEGQVKAAEERIAATRVSNNAVTMELQKLNQELALINRQNNAQSAKRKEFEARAKKSGDTERVFVKYRTELQAALTDFTTAVVTYRKKYLEP